MKTILRYIELVKVVDSMQNWRTPRFRKFVRKNFGDCPCREIAGYWVQHSSDYSAKWLDGIYNHTEQSVYAIYQLMESVDNKDIFEIRHSSKDLIRLLT